MGVNIVGKVFLGLGAGLLIFAAYEGFTGQSNAHAAAESVGKAAKGLLKAGDTSSGKFKVTDAEVKEFGHETPYSITVFAMCSKGEACPTIAMQSGNGDTLDCSKDGANGGCQAGDCGKGADTDPVPVCAVYGIGKGDYTFEASKRVTILSVGAAAQAGWKASVKGGESLMDGLLMMLAGAAGILTLICTGLCMMCCGACTTPETSASAAKE